MSYRVDLDEYTTDALVDELKRRQDAVSDGNCSYCGRSVETPPCKLELRHTIKAAPTADAALHNTGDRRGWDISERTKTACDFIDRLGLGNAFHAWLETRR